MQSITKELLEELKQSKNIDVFFSRHKDDFINQDTADYLNQLLAAKNLSVANVASMSGAGEYVYKIFNSSRKPSRDMLIAISFGMKLSLEETQFLLRIAKFACLDSRNKRDSVIIYAISHGMDVFHTDDMLDELKLVTLN